MCSGIRSFISPKEEVMLSVGNPTKFSVVSYKKTDWGQVPLIDQAFVPSEDVKEAISQFAQSGESSSTGVLVTVLAALNVIADCPMSFIVIHSPDVGKIKDRRERARQAELSSKEFARSLRETLRDKEGVVCVLAQVEEKSARTLFLFVVSTKKKQMVRLFPPKKSRGMEVLGMHQDVREFQSLLIGYVQQCERSVVKRKSPNLPKECRIFQVLLRMMSGCALTAITLTMKSPCIDSLEERWVKVDREAHELYGCEENEPLPSKRLIKFEVKILDAAVGACKGFREKICSSRYSPEVVRLISQACNGASSSLQNRLCVREEGLALQEELDLLSKSYGQEGEGLGILPGLWRSLSRIHHRNRVAIAVSAITNVGSTL